MPTPDRDDYEARQAKHDAEYLAAYADAPESFLKAAERRRVGKASIDEPSKSLEYKENYLSASYEPDMAELIDTKVDRLIEKHGFQYEKIIRDVVASLEEPIKEQIEKSRAQMLGRVACYLVKAEAQNVLARVHSLLHAIPKMAAANGFKSMRESARVCKVSAQWIKISRDRWCWVLGIPVPEEGTKSEDAKVKYRENANGNHWRGQKVMGKNGDQAKIKCPKNLKTTTRTN